MFRILTDLVLLARSLAPHQKMSEGSPTTDSRKHVSGSSPHSHTLAGRAHPTIADYDIARDAEMRRGGLDRPPATMIEHHLQRSLFSELSRFRKPVLERHLEQPSPPETRSGVATEDPKVQDICVVVERPGSNREHGEGGAEQAVANQNYEGSDSEAGAGGRQDAASSAYDTGFRGWYGSNHTNGGGRFMECVLIIK